MLVRRSTTLLLLLAAAALLLVGCGSDDGAGSSSEGAADDSSQAADDDEAGSGSDGGESSGKAIELGVDGNKLEFDKTELEASAGTVTLRLTNTSSIPHNVAIETEDGETLDEGEVVAKDGVSEATADLEPGTYTFYCTPHKGAGMVGTLVVS